MSNYTPTLTIIAPIYNESGNVEPLVTEIISALKNYPKAWEIILIDDGSWDDTYRELITIAQKRPFQAFLKPVGEHPSQQTLTSVKRSTFSLSVTTTLPRRLSGPLPEPIPSALRAPDPLDTTVLQVYPIHSELVKLNPAFLSPDRISMFLVHPQTRGARSDAEGLLLHQPAPPACRATLALSRGAGRPACRAECWKSKRGARLPRHKAWRRTGRQAGDSAVSRQSNSRLGTVLI